MIVTRKKPPEALLAMLRGFRRVALVGCGSCAAACQTGGEKELVQLRQFLEAHGFAVVGTALPEECCHMLLVKRDLKPLRECGAEAITDVLLGQYNPGGKLPVTVAYHAGQLPLYYNHPNGSAWHQGGSIGFADYMDCPHRPRYPFGFGLSYTSFEYAHLTLSAKEISPDESLTVTAEIQNVGGMDGDEVVQLYISDRCASRTRPVQELAGFCRVHLRPGEKKTVRFSLRPSQLAFLDKDMRWKIENGEFSVRIGTSSEDIRLESHFSVKEDAWIDGKTRAIIAEAEVSP